MLTITWRAGALLSLLPLCGCADRRCWLPCRRRIFASRSPRAANSVGRSRRQIHASNLARVPIRDAEDLGAGRYRMVLVCPDTATCRAAVAARRGRPFLRARRRRRRPQSPTHPDQADARSVALRQETSSDAGTVRKPREHTMTSLNHRIARTVSALAVLALPALAAAPIDASTPSGLRRASTPTVDIRHARVIVKYRAEGALMRESALSARDPDRVAVQHAARLSQRLGIPLRDGAIGRAAHAGAACQRHVVGRAGGAAAGGPRCRVRRGRRARAHHRGTQRSALCGQPAAATSRPRPDSGTCGRRTATFVSAINAETAWDTTDGSPAIVVAVLDTGVRPDHPGSGGQAAAAAMTSCRPIRRLRSRRPTTAMVAIPTPSDPGDWVTPTEAASGPAAGLRRRRQQLARHADRRTDRCRHRQWRRAWPASAATCG